MQIETNPSFCLNLIVEAYFKELDCLHAATSSSLNVTRQAEAWFTLTRESARQSAGRTSNPNRKDGQGFSRFT